MTASDKFVFFFRASSPYSNWHPSIFTVKGVTFGSNEQFMMYCKAKLFKDEVIAEDIHAFSANGLMGKYISGSVSRDEILKHRMSEWSAEQKRIKALGRKVSGFVGATWDEKCVSYVSRGAYEKFSQDPELAALIASEKGKQFVEASPYDRIWGVGLSVKDSSIHDPSKWKGQNLLGKALDQTLEKILLDLEQGSPEPASSPMEL